jgi:hypothetical protein
MPDRYELRTQYIPALLCSLPFTALGVYFLHNLDTAFWNTVLAQAAGGIGMAAALYYLASKICRSVGKMIEEKTFKDGREFPTSRFLMDDDDHFSDDFKQEIFRKVKNELGIELSGKTSDRATDKKRVHEAVGRIRQKFFQKNELIAQRNIDYGFSRNLLGGAIVALLASVLVAALSTLTNADTALRISALLIIWNILLIVFGWLTLRSNADRYAHTLFTEFVSS